MSVCERERERERERESTCFLCPMSVKINSFSSGLSKFDGTFTCDILTHSED